MKRLRFLPFVLFVTVVGIALGTAAFTLPSGTKKNLEIRYYRFDGTDNADATIQAPGNWVDLGTDEPDLACSESSGIICYVHFNGDLTAYQSYVSNKTFGNIVSAGIVEEYKH